MGTFLFQILTTSQTLEQTTFLEKGNMWIGPSQVCSSLQFIYRDSSFIIFCTILFSVMYNIFSVHVLSLYLVA